MIAQKIRKSKSPKGVVLNQIALRLRPEEVALVKAKAEQLNMGVATAARLACMAGLHLITTSPNTADASPAVPQSGADRIVGTASFYSQPTGQS